MKLKGILQDWRAIISCAFALALPTTTALSVVSPHTDPTYFVLLQLGLLLPILLACGKYLLAGVRTPGADRLLALGVLAAVSYSAVSLYWVATGDPTAAGQIYLSAAGATMALYLLGRAMEDRGTRRAAQLDEQLAGSYIQPEPGETIVVRVGERIPADGVITTGAGALDESLVTGVGMPADKNPGDIVFAGTMNLSAELTIKVGEKAPNPQPEPQPEQEPTLPLPPTKNKTQSQAERLSNRFVYIFTALAVVSGAVYLTLSGGDSYLALSVLFWVLMSACPAAIYLAAPIAAMAGTAKGSEQSVVVKNPGELEVAHQLDVLVIDKTGTLTIGLPVLSDILPEKGIDKSELLLLAASAAGVSKHPLMRAITARAREERLVPLSVERFQILPGKGLRANIGEQVYHLGVAGFIEQNRIPIQGMLSFEGYRLQAEGKSTLYLARGGQLIGIIAVADIPKKSSAPAIKELIAAGLDIVMVTGDARWPAGKVAGAVGITQIVARASAQEKVSQVRRFQAMGKRVAMVGDGTSDAQALAAADLGIAIGQNTATLAKLRAGITIGTDDLTAIPETMRLSRATARATRQNMFICLWYGLLCAVVAAGALYPITQGFMLPGVLLAAVLLAAGTVMVNAVRLAVTG